MDLETKVKQALQEKKSRRSFMKFLGRMTAASYVGSKACVKSCGKALLYGTTFTAGAVTGLTKHLEQMAADLPLYQDNGLAILVSYGTLDEELVYNTATDELHFGHEPVTIKNPLTGEYVSYPNPREISLLLTDTELKEVGKLFLGAYRSRIELALQQKTNHFIEGATKQDLYNVLHNPQIQSVVVLGHGYWSGWQASDEFVSTIMLEQNSWEQKRGYFLRHTCGTLSNDPVKVFRLQDSAKSEIQSFFTNLNSYDDYFLDFSSLTFNKVKGDYYSELEFNLTVPSYYFGPLKDGSVTIPLNTRLLCGLGKGQESLAAGSFFDLFEDYLPKEDFPKVDKRKSFEEKEQEFNQLQTNKLFREYTSEIISSLRDFFNSYIVETDWQFGTQVFPSENIFGWKRVAYPWDYFRDPFAGKNPPPPSYAFKPCTR